ncbi:YicC family protein [Reichenbachiella carrageenanivorans]|uniref:YicC family protein n=1 Tax=Reichenbachiella carrageenanivorans TaxID=2979869 RepID=A0ABY6D3N0_9BACT|nr:YicC/YloC family endoribonuclease [Reichenbachiella carrageenanivorans]UXX80389.1 YicC family protein [Reichenbachiella carrageenanivorans]
MTGYGHASFENDRMSIDVEIKSLNSKFLDISTKLPKEISALENEIKKVLTEKIGRGKVNFMIDISLKNGVGSAAKLNTTLFEHYKKELRATISPNELSDTDLVKEVLRMPDIFDYSDTETDLVDKDQLFDLINQAIKECEKFRAQEGQAAENALGVFAKHIGERLSQIKEKDPERIVAIKERINESLSELAASDKADPNRFEQELIYYIEKLDIAEEIIRLQNHISYFHETLAEKESQGKKLGFISQEMGREINTIGSKANNSDIQKLVVDMKDELEKIKEQVLNVV